MIGIAEGHCNEEEPTRPHQVETVTGQPIGLNHVLQEVTAEQRLRPKRAQAPDIGGIGQIGLYIDPWKLARVDVDDLYIARTQWEEHLILDPRLDTLAHLYRTAAEIKQRRESFGRECVERTTQPTGLGFKHLWSRALPQTHNDASIPRRHESATHLSLTTNAARPTRCLSRAQLLPPHFGGKTLGLRGHCPYLKVVWLFTRASCSVSRRRRPLRPTFAVRTISRIICASSTRLPMSSSRPSTTPNGSTANCRWASPLSRAKVAGLKVDSKDIPLSLMCLTIGPLVYAASLGTVAAMLVLAFLSLVLSHQHGLPVAARSIRTFAYIAPFLAWMLASSAWSLDSKAAAAVMLRVTVLVSGGIVLVTSFALLPLERLRLPLTAAALGLSTGGVVVAVDLVLGGHFAIFLHGPQPAGIDPALAYGRAATLNAILMVPVLVGLWRFGAPRFAAACAFLTTIAILETSSLSAKTALAAGLLTLVAVLILPQLRWVVLALLGLATVTLPLLFPVSLDAEATCWLADNKPSALHRLEIWSFVAEHIKQHPIAGWGLDAARRLPGGTSQVIIHHCDAANRPDGIALSSQTLPLHSHNAILQVWLELGGIGVALGFGPLVFMIWQAFRTPAWRAWPAQAMISGTAIAAVSVGLVSFGIWQEWFLSGLFVAAAFVVLAARQSAAAARVTPV